MRLHLAALATVLGLQALAQAAAPALGARFAGMGHTSTTLVDLWSVRANQAGLAGLEAPVAGAYYQQHCAMKDSNSTPTSESNSTLPNYFEHTPDFSITSSEYSTALIWLLSHDDRPRAMARMLELQSMSDAYTISLYGAADAEINAVL